MTHHSKIEVFYTEVERNTRMLELQAQGFRQQHSLNTLEHMDYRLSEGSNDPYTFDGLRVFRIEWCVVK